MNDKYKIVCVDRRWRNVIGPLAKLTFVERFTVKTVDTEREAMDYCTNQNTLDCQRDVYHYFEKIGDEEE